MTQLLHCIPVIDDTNNNKKVMKQVSHSYRRMFSMRPLKKQFYRPYEDLSLRVTIETLFAPM